jgi:hypothetical protein
MEAVNFNNHHLLEYVRTVLNTDRQDIIKNPSIM